MVGFGTVSLQGDDGVTAIRAALETGYRLLDTAVNYENEEEVGQAVRDSGLSREDVRITTKIPGRHHEYSQAVGPGEDCLGEPDRERLSRAVFNGRNTSV